MSSKNLSGGIKAIDASSVHRITSGQVVIDLQTAVKELVENSLDAGATSIEVRFKNYGLKSIEVVDNGSGISESDHDSIGRKHHTSKLSSFHHLTTLTSFGFRGEALSSLCALCDSVTVTTATSETAPMGAIIELDKVGEVKKKERGVRQRGTSVLLTSPFTPLPVRRKELERNIKREFGKTLTLLNAYALGPCCGLGSSDEARDRNQSRGRAVRFIVTNQPDKGSKVTHISLPLPSPSGSASSIRAGAIALWGPKALDGVIELKLEFHVPRIMAKRTKQNFSQADGEEDETFPIHVTGLISSPTPMPGSSSRSNSGRSGTDRQFFYVNGRPCALNKVQKVINETYRSFSPSNSGVAQFPFVVADFALPGDAIDVNVTPDKRTILVHAETHVIDGIKSALEQLFAPSSSTYSVNGAQNRRSASMPQPQQRVQDTSNLLRSMSMKPTLGGGKDDEGSGTEDESEGEQQGQTRPTTQQAVPDKQTREKRTENVTPVSKGPGRKVAGLSANRGRDQSAADSSASSMGHSKSQSHSMPPISTIEDEDESPPNTRHSTTPVDDGLSAPEDRDIPMAIDDSPDLPPENVLLPQRRSESGAEQTLSSLSPPPQAVYPTIIRKPLTEKPAVVLNTGNASWSRTKSKQKDTDHGEVEQEPPRKKRRSSVSRNRATDGNEGVNEDDNTPAMKDDSNTAKDDTAAARKPSSTSNRAMKVIRQTVLTETFKPKTPRQELRSQLLGFARSGSQVAREPESDNEEEEENQQDAPQPERARQSPLPPRHAEGVQGTAQSLFLPDDDGADDSMLMDLDEDPISSSVVTSNSLSSGLPASSSTGMATSINPSSSSSQMVDLTLDGDLDDTPFLSVSGHTESTPSRNDPIDRPEVIRTSSQSGNVHLRVNLSAISERWSRLHDRLRAAKAESLDASADADTGARSSLVADAGVSNIDEQASAEAALSRVIDKKDFGEMEVLGQFNLGFIIVRRRKAKDGEGALTEDDEQMEDALAGKGATFDDLFIVDQHAADEKYNFETLQQTTNIQSQKLFRPQPLELTAADELLALENLDILKRNGFELEVQKDDDDTGPSADGCADEERVSPRHKLKLVAQPVSKSTVFGMRDLEELIQLMHDRPTGQMVRCSKARAMFAMRACRKSVMVGMPLTKSQMTMVVQHMGTMDQPWNCPHGRPTMRHLFDLNTTALSRTSQRNINWATFTQ